MSEQTDSLGGRLPLLKPQEMNEAQKLVYARLQKTAIPWANGVPFQVTTEGGRVIGPFNPVLFSPGIAPAFLEFQGAEAKATTLTERERQVVILCVGSVWQSGYELYAHSAAARKAGFSETTIRSLVRGDSADELDDRERTAQKFTKSLVSERRLEESLYGTASQLFGSQGLMDMTFLIGSYLCVCTILNAFAIPVPAVEGDLL